MLSLFLCAAKKNFIPAPALGTIRALKTRTRKPGTRSPGQSVIKPVYRPAKALFNPVLGRATVPRNIKVRGLSSGCKKGIRGPQTPRTRPALALPPAETRRALDLPPPNYEQSCTSDVFNASGCYFLRSYARTGAATGNTMSSEILWRAVGGGEPSICPGCIYSGAAY